MFNSNMLAQHRGCEVTGAERSEDESRWSQKWRIHQPETWLYSEWSGEPLEGWETIKRCEWSVFIKATNVLSPWKFGFRILILSYLLGNKMQEKTVYFLYIPARGFRQEMCFRRIHFRLIDYVWYVRGLWEGSCCLDTLSVPLILSCPQSFHAIWICSSQLPVKHCLTSEI